MSKRVREKGRKVYLQYSKFENKLQNKRKLTTLKLDL